MPTIILNAKQEKVAVKVMGGSVRATEEAVRTELGLPPKRPKAKEEQAKR